MKTAITMLSFSDYIKTDEVGIREFIHMASEYGADAVDFLEYYWRDKEKEIKEIPKMLENVGLEIGAFCVGNNFIVENEERRRQVDYVKDGIRTAGRLNAKILRVFGGRWKDRNAVPLPGEDEKRRYWEAVCIDCLYECTRYAEENGVVLALENHKDLPVKTEETLRMIKAIHSPCLKLNLDIGNVLGSAEEDPVAAVETMHEYVVHTHVKDLVRNTACEGECSFVPVGEGIVPIKESLQRLKQYGYEGCVSLEYEAWENLESKAGVKKSVGYLKRVLREIG